MGTKLFHNMIIHYALIKTAQRCIPIDERRRTIKFTRKF